MPPDSAPVPPQVFLPDELADGRVAALCKALGHPHRVYIVRFLLARGASYAGEIVEALPLAASTVSQHLSQLRSAGVIVGEVEGPRRRYSVADGVVTELCRLLGALAPATLQG